MIGLNFVITTTFLSIYPPTNILIYSVNKKGASLMCDINCVQKIEISDKTEMNKERHYPTLKRSTFYFFILVKNLILFFLIFFSYLPMLMIHVIWTIVCNIYRWKSLGWRNSLKTEQPMFLGVETINRNLKTS